MKYKEFIIHTESQYGSEKEIFAPILTAELADLGFESFVEEENHLKAYILEELFKEDELNNLYCLKDKTYTVSDVKEQNWNEEWEKNYPLINIENKCCIRASFHDKQAVDFDILINPKMSFGTGHHETTYMMTDFLLEEDVKEKTVLDMGCGTAVLAILAKMKQAKYVEAIDIDEWAFENSKENIDLNNQEITCKLGGAELLGDKIFDVILANINRNILLQDMHIYADNLKEQGFLFLSGFYNTDIETIQNEALKYDLKLVDQKSKNYWVSLKLQKQ